MTRTAPRSDGGRSRGARAARRVAIPRGWLRTSRYSLWPCMRDCKVPLELSLTRRARGCGQPQHGSAPTDQKAGAVPLLPLPSKHGFPMESCPCHAALGLPLLLERDSRSSAGLSGISSDHASKIAAWLGLCFPHAQNDPVLHPAECIRACDTGSQLLLQRPRQGDPAWHGWIPHVTERDPKRSPHGVGAVGARGNSTSRVLPLHAMPSILSLHAMPTVCGLAVP